MVCWKITSLRLKDQTLSNTPCDVSVVHFNGRVLGTQLPLYQKDLNWVLLVAIYFKVISSFN